MTRPKSIDTVNTRVRLLEVGLSLFAKKGYHGTGIKEIVDTAHVPKGSFYNYFTSKEEFGIEIARWHMADFWEKWHSIMDANSSNPLQGLKDCFEVMLDRHFDCAVNTFSVAAHIAAEICESSSDGRFAMKVLIETMRDNLAEYIRKAQELDLARRDVDAKDLASLFWDTWTGSILRMKMENRVDALTQCVTIFFDRFLKQ
ncbi:MAG: TetR/AcrR family transcriptional regulator [Desulfuromonadaceae bacterium]|nr:TetR/AcrR family transcriptional regulator [Desulfuromonadaceae bacterium]